ncbi:uncharacterized protein JN550_009422 [Neoarthrinium moseri]|uniref:uncharacterized protein n=1 Tax=Neoarthrinium moseri TaxID=1658444 RepID=UPI001FDD0E99|nr:uncharacterized protein JN550_009422 [Neoarthrinium moseri]KAI1863722.1 hypothetical protein JN550_009422 [Neoarthrinium moseri]
MVITPTTTITSTPESSRIDEISHVKAEEILRLFRTLHLKFYPLIYLPDTTSARELQHERPFLWLVIRAVCAQSAVEQDALGDQVREILAKQLIVDCERSIDMLLGMLTYMGWSMYFARGKPYICAFTNLILATASDLRLNRIVPQETTSNSSLNCFKPYAFPKPPTYASDSPKARTNEDRRAVLGCFLTVVTMSSYMKLDVARSKVTIDDCLEQLWETPEIPNDRVLVAITRIMGVADEAVRMASRPEDTDDSISPIFHIKGLEESLKQVKRDLPPDLLDNQTVTAQLRSTEVAIYELALSPQTSSSAYKIQDYRRREYLQMCLESAKAFMDVFLQIEPAEYCGIPLWLMIQFAHCAQAIYRLSLLDDPGWDRSAVRQFVDVLEILERAAVRMTAAHEACGYSINGSDKGVFTRSAAALRATIPQWSAALEQVGAIAARPTARTNPDLPVDPMLIDFTDDTWLTDVFSSWDETR